jgi:LysM repeat protein
MGARRQISLRMLAPASLALFSVILLVILVSSLGGDSSSTTPAKSRTVERSSSASHRGTSTTTATPAQGERRFYVVKPGDTLSKISVATGVSVEQLQVLNPAIDPHALVNGERIRLRE